MKNRISRWYRAHKRTQVDIPLGPHAKLGYLCLGRDGRRPVAYWSPDATPTHKRAVGPRRRHGL